eukprot:7536405-Alexandrium_andersonii.AAC.1
MGSAVPRLAFVGPSVGILDHRARRPPTRLVVRGSPPSVRWSPSPGPCAVVAVGGGALVRGARA